MEENTFSKMLDNTHSINILSNNIDIENIDLNADIFRNFKSNENTLNANQDRINQNDKDFSNEQVLPSLDAFPEFLNQSLFTSDQNGKIIYIYSSF